MRGCHGDILQKDNVRLEFFAHGVPRGGKKGLGHPDEVVAIFCDNDDWVLQSRVDKDVCVERRRDQGGCGPRF